MMFRKLSSSKVFIAMQKYRYVLVIALLFLFILSSHLYKITDIPNGTYFDETSIGINAAGIAQSGKDEHGVSFPLYFEAFGDYKNPPYLYTAAALFKVFGASEFTLRFTSFLYFALSLVLFFVLVRDIFPSYKKLHAYALVAFGFIPYFFIVSRVSFEVISYVFFTVAFLVVLYRTFHREGSSKYVYPILTGVLLGLCTYAYSSARLMSFLILIIICILYLRKATRYKILLIFISALVVLIPYFLFVQNHPGALTARFEEISYVYTQSLTFWDKVEYFYKKYLEIINFQFLITDGDNNLRHNSGYGGMVFFSVLLLAGLGIISHVRDKKVFREKFFLFILLCFVAAPVPAALTTSNVHALRTILMGVFLLVLSLYGYIVLEQIRDEKAKRTLLVTAWIFLILESTMFLHNYFFVYSTASATSFSPFNVGRALEIAVAQKPEEIFVIDRLYDTNLEFYMMITPNPDSIKITQLNKKKLRYANTCIIGSRSMLKLHEAKEKPVFVDTTFDGERGGVYCYKQ